MKHLRQTNLNLKRHRQCSLRQKMSIVERHLGHLLATPQTDHFEGPLLTDRWGETWGVRRRVQRMWLKRGAVQCLLLSPRTKPESELERFPYTRINWGVLMDSEWINWWLSYFAVLTQCALTTQHTHVHVHHYGAMQMFTPMSWFVSFCEQKGFAINLALSNNIKLQT